MLNKLVLEICVFASVVYFVSSYEVTVEKTPKGFIIHPKDTKNTNSLSPRIIGGEEVTPHQYPFQAALLIYKGNDQYLCGGTLITNQWVLTAAHCLDMKPKVITVILGAHDLQNLDDDTVQLFNTTKYKRHAYWDATIYRNDIALIRLPTEVVLSEYVNFVHLATDEYEYVGIEGTILGWGKTETENQSMVLRQVAAIVIRNPQCANANPNYANIVQSMHICTSGDGIKRSCNGDSGGPLLIYGRQVGIVSFGTADCPSDMPSVFTRETYFSDWIRQNLNDEGFDDPGDDDNGGDDDNNGGDDDNNGGDDDGNGGDDDGNGGDDDGNGGNDDNDDGGANSHSLHFVVIVLATLMYFVRFFDLM